MDFLAHCNDIMKVSFKYGNVNILVHDIILDAWTSSVSKYMRDIGAPVEPSVPMMYATTLSASLTLLYFFKLRIFFEGKGGILLSLVQLLVFRRSSSSFMNLVCCFYDLRQKLKLILLLVVDE